MSKEQPAKSNEQRAKSNDQWAKSNEQRATSEKFHLILKNGIWKKERILLQLKTTKVVEMKGIVILVKVDEYVQYLEKCPSHCLTWQS